MGLDDSISASQAPALGRGQGEALVRIMSLGVFLLAIISATLQVAILPSAINISCASLCLMGTALSFWGLLKHDVLSEYPISSFSIFGAFLMLLWSPLVFTTLEWRPIVFEMQVPVQTFAWSLAFCCTLILSHALYRTGGLGRMATVKFSRFWSALNLFDRPHDLLYWLMGGIGYICLFYIYVIRQTDAYTIGFQSTGIKFISGFIPFAYAPFILLSVPFLEQGRPRVPWYNVVGCVVLVGIFLATAILSNIRGIFAVPLLTVGLVFLVLGFIGRLRLGPKLRVVFVVAIPVGLLALSQLSDLALAMRAARAGRGNINALTMMKDTLAIFGDKHYLAEYREDINVNANSPNWSENYVSSVFLSRFINTKFVDNSLALIPRMDDASRRELVSYTNARTLGFLPGPLYNRVGAAFPKEYVMSFSMGDYMFLLATGEMIQGFKTGSLIGNGVAIMGYGFIPFIFVIAMPIFCFFDSFSRVFSAFAAPPVVAAGTARRWHVRNVIRHSAPLLAISPLVLIFINDYFIFWTTESVSGLLLGLTRGFVQKLFFYWCMVQLGRLIFRRPTSSNFGA